MGDIRSLRSYLVSLGFSVNTAQLSQFNNAMKSAAQLVNTNTTNMITNINKFGTAAIATFEGIGVAVAALADKVATADQSYRLFGQRMFMGTQQAKSLKVAMDALGQPLEAIAFDPELHRRFADLTQLQTQLQGMLGPDFKQTMIQLRDAQFEFTRFRVEALYFRDLLVKQIFQALGGEKLTEKLRSWNNYIVQHIPEWSRIISTYITPILKDAWSIMQDLWEVARSFAQLFTNIIGLISGDPALQGTISFAKFAASLERVAHWLAVIIHYATKLAGTIEGAGLGGAAGLLVGGPAGILPGMGIGAALGGMADIARALLPSGDTVSSNLPAGANDLDAMSHAVAQVESGGRQTDRFGRTIQSSAGALGMMQLLPSTARGLGVDPYNAQQNFAGGRAYLAQLYRQFGNWHDALAAYNWGPGHVQGALRRHQAFPEAVEGYTRAVGAAYNQHVQVGSINIMQPNASPEQIQKAVANGINDWSNKTTTANLAELRAMYG